MQFPDIHCKYCGKWLGEFSLQTFVISYHNYLPNGKRGAFCNENCYQKYTMQFEIVYKDTTMYKVGDEMYIPYMGCFYYFKTAEDCYQRMQQKRLCYFP